MKEGVKKSCSIDNGNTDFKSKRSKIYSYGTMIGVKAKGLG